MIFSRRSTAASNSTSLLLECPVPSICDGLQLRCCVFSSGFLSLVWNSWATRKRRLIARKERLLQFRMVVYIHVCLVSSTNPTQDSPEMKKRPNSNVTFDETRDPLEPWITAGAEGWPGVWEISWQWQRTPRQDVFFLPDLELSKVLGIHWKENLWFLGYRTQVTIHGLLWKAF